MKQMLIFSAISLILFASSFPVCANVAPPPKPKEPNEKTVMFGNLEVKPDAKASEARLLIPRARLRELQAALASEGGDESAATRGIAYSSTSVRTIFAGLFLFTSLSFAGVWLARGAQRRGQKIVAAVMLGTALVGATAIITNANGGLPAIYFWRELPQNLSAGRSTHGQMRIEIVSDDKGFKLIIPLKKSENPDKATGEE